MARIFARRDTLPRHSPLIDDWSDILAALLDSGARSFAAAWEGRQMVSIGERLVPFLGRVDLVANKRATGRLQDLADLEALDHPAGE
jgi:hypothetical protein